MRGSFGATTGTNICINPIANAKPGDAECMRIGSARGDQ
jgi:hypothetical protein